jgi:two-component system, OmpR family, phosphate regulon response regulator PhoB
LERGGFNVVEANTVEAALDLLDEQMPDAIITDLSMTGQADGCDLCRILRSREDTQNIPIIIFTAKGDKESINRGLEAGANDYVPKGMAFQELLAKLRELLD